MFAVANDLVACVFDHPADPAHEDASVLVLRDAGFGSFQRAFQNSDSLLDACDEGHVEFALVFFVLRCERSYFAFEHGEHFL